MSALSIADDIRVAAIVLGAETHDGTWRPSNERLATMVDLLDPFEHPVDVCRLLDDLDAHDPEWPWAAHLRWLLATWGRAQDAAHAVALRAERTCAAEELNEAVDAMNRIALLHDQARERAVDARSRLVSTLHLEEQFNCALAAAEGA